MAVAEQLHIYLKADEKSVLSEAARRQNVSLSAYIRNRLFGPPLSQADQVLMDGLAALRPRFETASKTINSHMAEIAQLRETSKRHATPVYPELPDESELQAIAEQLNLSRDDSRASP